MTPDPGSRGRDLMAALDRLADPDHAAFHAGFFRSGTGGYGEGDVFLGVRVPQVRAAIKPCLAAGITVEEAGAVLDSPVHEHRLAALLVLVAIADRARRTGQEATRRAVYDLYLRRTERVNNWDLVDSSCREIVGGYLIDRPLPQAHAALDRLAASPSLWERRIAAVSTWTFLKQGRSGPTYRIARRLIADQHDLIHKAVGWMLREAGQRVDQGELCAFLDRNASVMPRTMLRYAIERLPPADRARYLAVRREPAGSRYLPR
jgi:3-methyladenine DNA glycosylase AlkD